MKFYTLGMRWHKDVTAIFEVCYIINISVFLLARATVYEYVFPSIKKDKAGYVSYYTFNFFDFSTLWDHSNLHWDLLRVEAKKNKELVLKIVLFTLRSMETKL